MIYIGIVLTLILITLFVIFDQLDQLLSVLKINNKVNKKEGVQNDRKAKKRI